MRSVLEVDLLPCRTPNRKHQGDIVKRRFITYEFVHAFHLRGGGRCRGERRAALLGRAVHRVCLGHGDEYLRGGHRGGPGLRGHGQVAANLDALRSSAECDVLDRGGRALDLLLAVPGRSRFLGGQARGDERED
jgi:hypothetical protein